MGVPGFFAWLRRKYPQIVDDSAGAAGDDGEGNACDNLYVDMNHIIHGCSHPKWRDDAYASELEIFQGIQQYLERLVRTCRPERLLMIAIDGVAPQAKMCQQRTRRFMSAHTEHLRKGIEKEVRREMLAQARNGIIIPPLTSFDGNVITPGTPFMARLAAHLRRFLAYKVGSDSDWRHIQVVLSDSNEPGEGEHKIMRFIRHQRACPEYDPNTRHVIYGQDADLILLALLTHEPHFSLLREAGSLEEAVKEMGLDPVEWSAAKHQPLQFLNVSTLREYLRFDFSDLVGEALEPPPASDLAASDPWHQEEDLPEPAPEENSRSIASESNADSNADGARPQGSDNDDDDADVTSPHAVSNGVEDSDHPNSISAEGSVSNGRQLAFLGGVNSDGQFDFERVLQDFVLLTFLSGNDFLPSIPSLEIYARPSGLDVLLKTYKEQLPALGGPITNGSVINMDRLKRMLIKLAEDEENAFKRLSLRRARDFQRLAEQENERNAGNRAGAGYSGPDGSGQWVSMGELGSNDLDQVLGGLGGEDAIQSHVLDLLTATPEELIRELCQRVTKRLEERLKGTSDADPVRLGVLGYRARMYEQRFGATPGEGVEKTARKVSHAYMQGLNWVLAYYVHGNTPVPVSSTHADDVAAAERQLQGKGRQSSAADSAEGLGASWDWYYPFHYAPLISDLAKFATGGKRSKVTVGGEVMSLDDDSWAPANGPVRPLVQLMAVLPPESARLCLPWKLAQILEGTRAKGSAEQTSMASALVDMFPSDLAPLIDMSGKIWAHTAVVKLPFADVKRLAIAAQQPDANEQELRPADEERNEIKAGTLVIHNSHPCATPLSLITKQGLSWSMARSQLVSSKRQSWDATPGKKSLSLLRLLVPDTDDSASMQLLAIREGLEQFVSMAGFDLTGVPVKPFSATLLPGCELPPAVVTERDWAKEQRKLAAPPGLGGRGRGRGGGYSTGGRGMAPGGRGSFAARGQGRGGGSSAVLTVPRHTVAVPIRNPDRPMWGQQGSSGRAAPASGVPDWGDNPSWQPSSSANLDDEAVSQQLQEQFDREVGGGASSGFGLSLEDESLAVARMLQEEEERKVRKEYRPPDRRTAQQLKADEDFALRMQRQEQEIEKHQLAHFREAQRRQMTQFNMGGVPQQDQQAALLPDAEFPGLSTTSSERATEAPKWPIQRVRDKPQPQPSSGWDAPATSPHIPAVHRDNTDNYSGWGAEGDNGWGGDDEVGGKWADSAGGGWEGDKTNGYHESGHVESAGNDYTAAHTQGHEGRGSKGPIESGWGDDEQPDRGWDGGWGGEQPDRSRNGGWGDEGRGDEGRRDEGASCGGTGRGATTEQAGGSWGDEAAAGGGWGPNQAGGSSRYEGSQASSGSRRGSASHVSQKEAAAADYMQSFALPPASSIKERAAAAQARIQQENAARQRREELEMQQLEQNPRRAPPPTYESGNAPPVSTQDTYEPDPFQSDEPPRYDALYNQLPKYQQNLQYGHPVPDVQSVQPQSSAINSAAPAYQPASARPSKALQAQSTVPTPAPAATSDIFDVDAWLLDMGISPAPQKQAPPAGPRPVSTVKSNQHLYDAAQYGSYNGSAGGSRPPSSGSDTSRTRYRPPHMRTDIESSTEVLSGSQPPALGNGIAYSSGIGRKPPPGFSAST